MALSGLYSSCRDLQSWLENQTSLFQTLQPQADNLEATQLKYEVRPPSAKARLLLPALLPLLTTVLLPLTLQLPHHH